MSKPAAIQKRFNALVEMGCIVCRDIGYRSEGYAEIHHIRATAGAGQKASDDETIPLCPNHHRLGYDGFHVSPELFQKKYGTELELLATVNEDLEQLYRGGCVVGFL